MIKKENYAALIERAMQVQGRSHMRAVVEKELLHYDLIFALEKGGLLEQLTFQGGTCLRLCYGSSRFSEDLDFVGGKNFASATLIKMKTCIEEYLGERYGLEVTVKEPKELLMEPEYQDIKIDKWRINILTSPERKDLPKQKIKIEVANIDAYSKIPRVILHNYDFLPDGYSDMLIIAESLDEILADKIISLVNCRKYVRHRDIWDLRWLKQRGAIISPDYVKNKIVDYKITDYPLKLAEMNSRINKIIYSDAFYQEMSRFIPMDVQERTLKKDTFKQFLANEIQDLLQQTDAILRV